MTGAPGTEGAGAPDEERDRLASIRERWCACGLLASPSAEKFLRAHFSEATTRFLANASSDVAWLLARLDTLRGAPGAAHEALTRIRAIADDPEVDDGDETDVLWKAIAVIHQIADDALTVAPASAVSAAPSPSWFSAGDWTFNGQPVNVDDMNAIVRRALEAAPERAVERVVRAAGYECPHDGLQRLRPAQGQPWWECCACGAEMVAAPAASPAGGPDSAIDAEIDRALADVSVIANPNTDQAHGFRVGYRAARRGESLIAWVRERCAVAAQEAYMPGTDPHGEWRRACRNAAAAILALEFGPSTVNNTKPLDSPPVCGGCGGPHHFDTTVPSPTWNRVIRAAGLSDYLCTTCIVRAFVAAGEGFTAELWGEDFNGVPIELRVRSLEAQTAADLGNENTALRARGSAADAAISDLAHAAGRHQADCSTCRQAMKRNADAIDRVLKPLPAPQAAE